MRTIDPPGHGATGLAKAHVGEHVFTLGAAMTMVYSFDSRAGIVFAADSRILRGQKADPSQRRSYASSASVSPPA